MNACAFSVRASDDGVQAVVEISQDDPPGDRVVIWIHPDQVDLLIEWLQKARADARLV